MSKLLRGIMSMGFVSFSLFGVAVVTTFATELLRLVPTSIHVGYIALLWLATSVFAWVILPFTHTNVKNNVRLKTLIVNIDSWLLQFIWSVIWLLAELGSASIVLRFKHNAMAHPYLSVIAIALPFEMAKWVLRPYIVPWVVATTLTSLQSVMRLSSVRFLCNRGPIGFIVTLAQVFVTIYTVVTVCGVISEPHHIIASPSNQSQISTFLSVVAQSLFTLLTIFVAVIIVLVQSLSSYSNLFLRTLIKDVVFWVSIVSLVFAALFSLHSLTQPLYTVFTYVWMVVFVQSVCSVIYVSWLVVHYVQVVNVIPQLGDQIIGIIKRGLILNTPGTKVKRLLWHNLVGLHRVKPLRGLLISEDVTINIIKRLEALMVLLDRGLNENRYDIAESVVHAVGRVVKAYVPRRKYNIYPNDSVLNYLVSEYGMRISKSNTVKNEKLLDVLVKSMTEIGILCLEFSGHTPGRGSNKFSESWMHTLEKAFVEGFQYDYTESSPLAIDGIRQIGVGLIDRGAIHSGVYGTARHLKLIGLSLCKQKGAWPSSLLQHVLGAYCALLTAESRFIKTKGFITDHRYVVEGMEKVFFAAVSIPDDFHDKQLLTASLVGIGDMVGGTTYISPFIEFLSGDYRTTKSTEHGLEFLLVIFRSFSRMADAAIRNRAGTTAWFIDAIAAILLHSITWMEKHHDDDGQQRREKFVWCVFDTAINLVCTNADGDNMNDDHFQALSDCCAIVAFTYHEGRDEHLLTLLEQGIERLCTKVRDLLDSGCESYDIAHLCRYIKLLSAWLYAESKIDESPVVKSVRQLLSEVFPNDGTAVRRKSFVSQYEQMDYPHSTLQNSWSLSSSMYWSGEYRDLVTSQLGDMRILVQFHQLCEGDITPTRD